MKAMAGCVYGCDPESGTPSCDDCARLKATGQFKTVQRDVPVVDLPLGATEDRVVGALDLERALSEGVKAFEPGLLARANRGFLYIDEVNLLEDHLVDLLIDVAASGETWLNVRACRYVIRRASCWSAVAIQKRVSCVRNCWIALVLRWM